MKRLLTIMFLLLALSGAAFAQETAPAASAVSADQDYHLGVADKVRVIVYDEPSLSGEYLVNANGSVSMSLIGNVPAQGRTASQVAEDIRTKLADGYIREPKVSIDVLTFRPYYILGEVKKPGQYPYSSGLTVLNAVATAEGFSYRADRKHVFLRRAGDDKEQRIRLDASVRVSPGDTVRIGERFF